jgi:hypothetical protein
MARPKLAGADTGDHAASTADAPHTDWAVRARLFTAISITPPRAILAMAEDRYREAALEVWRIAVRLDALIEVANYFLLAAKVGRRISDDDLRVIAWALDGELWAGDVQRVLDHLAARPSRFRPARVPRPDEPFPWAEFWGVVLGFGRAVRRLVSALAEHGVLLPSLSAPDDDDGWAAYAIRYESEGDSVDPASLTLSPPFSKQIWALHDAVNGLLGRLETAPSRVVTPPVYPDGVVPVVAVGAPVQATEGPAGAGRRLRVDRQTHRVILDDMVYGDDPVWAALFDVLARHPGERLSLREMKKLESGLKDEPRIDRLLKRLPRELRNLIEVNSKGCKLSREVVT